MNTETHADNEVHTADDAAADGLDVNVQQSDADRREAYQPTPYDDMARDLGWRAPGEYAGNEPFRSAEEYIKTAVKGTRSVRKDLKDMKKQMEGVVRASSVAMDRALNEQRTALEREYTERVEAGDAKGARAVNRELDKLERQESTPVNYENDFAERNPWYGKDDEATAYAVSISQRAANNGKTPEEQLEAAEAAVRKRFPELYDEPKTAARKAPLVSTPASRTGSLAPRKKGPAELPDHARKAWQQFDKDFKARGFKDGYPIEDYAKDYFADNP